MVKPKDKGVYTKPSPRPRADERHHAIAVHCAVPLPSRVGCQWVDARRALAVATVAVAAVRDEQ
ncbi:hypothetical protein EYF80_008429 [Liparis tanakae]|uniref:Uncharacterized protein n=1 Tax=Liparis tanakae TaxID=230148 RepID=A0A4Z2IVW9_9TELE|nr:hypothetical protein EYF80_008429 [Liparis tanakae]